MSLLLFPVKSLSFELYDNIAQNLMTYKNIQLCQYFSKVLMEILFTNG